MSVKVVLRQAINNKMNLKADLHLRTDKYTGIRYRIHILCKRGKLKSNNAQK